jgi:serine/threonine protein kinase/GTPase SAR1 family protein/Ran GTPase-activating protein (RanGAP) involved in mRNA processing and transport
MASTAGGDDMEFFGLSLAAQHLTKNDGRAIGEAFHPDMRLCNLDLSSNQLGDTGALALASAAKHITALTSLNLEKNGVSAKAVKSLVELLRPHNFSLIELRVGRLKSKKSKGFGSSKKKATVTKDDVGKALEEFLESNRSIHRCQFRDGRDVLLSGRRLQRMPEFVESFAPYVTRVDLSRNAIGALPAEIGDFVHLISLNVAENVIERLPDEIGLLQELQTLDVRSNRLTTLPHAVVLLETLENLHVDNNRLEDFPLGIGTLNKLRQFTVDGNSNLNPDKFPRAEVKKGGAALLASLKQRVWLGVDKRDSYQMKLTVLGRGNVGKTSLLRALKIQDSERHANFKDALKRAPPNVATDGVEFDKWTVARTGNRLEFTVLDCAGQSVYHLTHQFFLTGKALYLIVINLQDGNYSSEIDYWLGSIRSLAGQSPVLIVGTHIDSEGVSRDYVRSLFEFLHGNVGVKYPMIKGYFGVSCTTGEGVSDLIDQMLQTVSELPWIPTSIPLSFDVLRDKLIAMERVGRQILTRRELSRLAITCGLQVSQVGNVLQWFSDIGLILQFDQCSNKELNNTIVLSPQWLSDLFKTIITLKSNYVNNGVLRYVDLQHIWKPPTVPLNLYSRCIALLEFFEAVYRYSSSTLLVPALLPRDPPLSALSKAWPEVAEERFIDLVNRGDFEGCHHARVFSFQFFPPDFFSRLIVRMLRSNAWEPVILWANGAVLRDRGDIAPASGAAGDAADMRDAASFDPTGKVTPSAAADLAAAADDVNDGGADGKGPLGRARANTAIGLTPRSARWMPNWLFIEIDTELNFISMRTRGSRSAATIARLSDSLEMLIRDWLHIGYRVFVPCFCSMKRLTTLTLRMRRIGPPPVAILPPAAAGQPQEGAGDGDAKSGASKKIVLPPGQLLAEQAADVGALLEHMLEQEMESKCRFVTDSLNMLKHVAAEETPLRYFMMEFLNRSMHMADRGARRKGIVSFIAASDVEGDESLQQRMLRLKQAMNADSQQAQSITSGAAGAASASAGAASIGGSPSPPSSSVSGTSPVSGSPPAAAHSINALPAEMRDTLANMSLVRRQKSSSLECVIEHVALPSYVLMGLGSMLRGVDMSSLVQLVSLRLIDCGIQPQSEGFSVLLDAVKRANKLSVLDLSNNALGSVGVDMLVRALGERGDSAAAADAADAGSTAAKRAADSGASLEVHVNNVAVSPDSAIALIKVVAQHSSVLSDSWMVASVSLRDNALDESFFAQLAPVLASSVAITSVDLADNPGASSQSAARCAALLQRNADVRATMRRVFNKTVANVQVFRSTMQQVIEDVSESDAALQLVDDMIMLLRRELPTGERSYRKRSYGNAFTAREIVGYVQQYLRTAVSRPCVVAMCERFIKAGYIVPVSKPNMTSFRDSDHVFRFGPDELLPHTWKLYGQILDELRVNLKVFRLRQGDDYHLRFLASDAVEYIAANHRKISREGAVAVMRHLSEFGAIFHPENPAQRFVDSDCEYFEFANRVKRADFLQTSGDAHLFPLRMLTSAIDNQHLVLRCPRWRQPIRVDGLVPDVALKDIPLPRFAIGDVERGRQLTGETTANGGGEVFAGVYNGEKVAVKVCAVDLEAARATGGSGGPATSGDGGSALDQWAEADRQAAFAEFRREVWMMCSIRHKHLVQLKGFCMKPLALLLEWMELGDMASYMKRQQPLDWGERLRLIAHVAKAMKFLHSNCPPICHLDLKTPNMLLSRDASGRLVAKVADFGLSRSLELTAALGTLAEQDNCIWLAPEILQQKPVTMKADVYSFAIVCWEHLQWKLPYEEHRFMHQIQEAVLQGFRPNLDGYNEEVSPADAAEARRAPTPYMDSSDDDEVEAAAIAGDVAAAAADAKAKAEAGGAAAAAVGAAAPPHLRSVKRFVDLIQLCWLEEPAARPTFDDIVDRVEWIRRVQRAEILPPADASARATTGAAAASSTAADDDEDSLSSLLSEDSVPPPSKKERAIVEYNDDGGLVERRTGTTTNNNSSNAAPLGANDIYTRIEEGRANQ